jgi:hypothetical protein
LYVDQRWARKIFFKSTNLQILGLNPQSQIRKFMRYANPKISFD